MKISKELREEAAMLCLIAVSGRCSLWRADALTQDEAELGPYLVADRAQQAAWSVLLGSSSYEDARDHSLVEAAAILRDGWSPGDPVYLLGDES